MSETSDALSEIKKMRSELDQHGEMLDALIRYSPIIRDSILDEFKKDKVLSAVYLLIDGVRTQQQITDIMKITQGASQPTVTRKIKELKDQVRVITPIAKDSNSWIYVHNRLGRALSLTKKIRKIHNLDIQ